MVPHIFKENNSDAIFALFPEISLMFNRDFQMHF